MRTIFNLTYIAIALGFARKIIDKCTYEAREGLPVEHNDSEGCYCLCCDNLCLEYSHDRFALLLMGNELIREIPKMKGHMKLVEDDNMCSCSADAVRFLTPAEQARADAIIVSYGL